MFKYFIGLLLLSISLTSNAEIKQCAGTWVCKITCYESTDNGSIYTMCNTHGGQRVGATVEVKSTARINTNTGSIVAEDVAQIAELCLAKDSFFAAAWNKVISLPSPKPVGTYVGYVGGSGICQ